MKEQKNDRIQKIQRIRSTIKIFQDFPKKGVSFHDVFSILSQPAILNDVMDIFESELQNVDYSKIFMLESRGFIFATPLSLRVNKPCYPFRKKGKLPGELIRVQYKLQYGSDIIQIQKQALNKGDKVIIVDDILATGGTLNAAIKLIEEQGGIVEKILLINIIAGLNGLQKLKIEKQKVFCIYES